MVFNTRSWNNDQMIQQKVKKRHVLMLIFSKVSQKLQDQIRCDQ